MSIIKSIQLLRRLCVSNITTTFNNVSNEMFNCAAVVNSLLTPQKVMVQPSCGLKVKGIVRKRCKDCYFVRREGRLYVMCHTFPRHKQVLIAPREKYTWIFSHACQSKLRPY